MSQSPATSRAQTLRFQSAANRLIRGLLRAPLTSRLVGQRLLTVYLVGRKSGRHYSIPVAYIRQGGRLLISSPFPWIRNLRTGDSVGIRLLGRRRSADVELFADEDGVVERLAVMARENHQFAKFNKIGLDERGQPSPNDLHLAWAAGARVVLLTPR